MENAHRKDADQIDIGNDVGLPIKLFAREDAPIEPKAIEGARRLARLSDANRLHLTLMAARALSECIGREIGLTLVHDAPHNLVWREQDGMLLHRKGACPAIRGEADLEFPEGHPVIVPGSMGTPSWLLSGLGSVAPCARPPTAPGASDRAAPRAEETAANSTGCGLSRRRIQKDCDRMWRRHWTPL